MKTDPAGPPTSPSPAQEVSDLQNRAPTIAGARSHAAPGLTTNASSRDWVGPLITERAPTQKHLHDRERRFREMVDALPAAIYTTDADGRLTHFNPAAVELSGRTPEIGTDEWCVSWKLFRPDGSPLPRDECPMAIALKEGRVIRGEEIIVERPDGTRLWCAPYPTPLRDAAGTIVGGINMLVDITERKQSEQRLRDTEQRFTRFMQHLPGLAWIKDADGRYVYANDAAQNAFQARGSDLYGKSDWDLFPPETAAQFTEHDRAALHHESSLQTIEVLEHPDGIVHHAIVSKFPIPGADGQTTMVGGVAIDITELESTEKALRESEAAFRALAEASPGFIWRLDPHGRFTYVNPRCLDYFGSTPAALLGGGWDPLVHPEDRRAYLAEVVASQRGRQRFQASARVKDNRGEWRWIESHALPLFGATDDYVGHVGFSLDITERRLAWEASAKLAAVVESSDDAIISKDMDGLITSWNAGAERLFGYSAQEAVGQPMTLIIPPDRHDEEPRVLERIRRGEFVENTETLRRRKDGTLVDVSLTVSPIRNDKGDVVGASQIARDITQSRLAAEMLRTANRRKDEFLALLAHELRNPLAPIVMSLENLRRMRMLEAIDEPETPPTERPADRSLGTRIDLRHRADAVMDVLERQVGQMVRLVDDLLDAGRISSGKIALRREHVELSPVIYHAVEAARLLSDTRGQELTVTLPAEPIVVNADSTRLAQVIGNLLNNASKFTDCGGHIWLTVERENEPRAGDVEPTCRRSPGVAIRVRDTGIGIAEDQIPYVFEMFTQLDTSLERSVGGLGIGLNLVKTLTQLHGGAVEVSSAGIGQGSEFVVRLPIVVESATLTEASRPAEPAARPLRVLIVDDSQDATDMLATFLALAGHETHTAHDGVAAIEATAKLQPDIVLLDIGLPGLNGYEAARRIRQWQSDKDRRPVLVALSGWGQDEDRRRSQEAGFDAHLIKPVDAVVLGNLLATLVAV